MATIKKKDNPKRITVRLEYLSKDNPDFVKWLASQAVSNNRSYVAQIRTILQDAFDQSTKIKDEA